MRTEHRPRQYNRKRMSLIIVTAVLVLVFGLNFGIRHIAHSCATLTNTNLEQMGLESNKDLISLAHAMGVQGPIIACTGDIGGMLAPDGYQSWVIKIPNMTSSDVAKFGCPVRSPSDQSNPQKVTFVHQAYPRSGRIMSYYSGEGRCSGGNISAVLVAVDDSEISSAYIIFSARHRE